jgi:hypothetical protein
MGAAYLYGWDETTEDWVVIAVDEDGYLLLETS